MTADRRPGAGYQILLVGLLSLNFGIVFFDRNAFGFLTSFVVADIPLTNTQIGLIGSALSLTWALSGVLIGGASDRTGRRKAFLIAATVVFALSSFLTGLATSFLMILGARMLMGAAEGSIMPISQSMTAAAVSERHRGLAMGAMQTTGAALLGSFLAPVALVWLAEAFGWRSAFYIAGVPGLATAALMWWLIREAPAAPKPAGAAAERLTIVDAFSRRNIVICTGVAILLVAYMLITWAFMPLFLIENRGFSPETMGWLMSVLGLAAVTFGIVAPAVSDRIGRKPVIAAVPLLGVLLPLAALYGSSANLVAAAFFAGWALAGTFAIFMATVPSETVPPQYMATALGLVTGMGEAVGGVGGPALAGVAADLWGREAVMWIMLGLCLAASLLALGLKETAPVVLARRAGAAKASPAAAQ